MLFTKHYSEMTNQELRDELAKMLKELRGIYRAEEMYFNDDFVRQYGYKPCNIGVKVYDEEAITVGLIKQMQTDYNLKDDDEVQIAYNEDDGFVSTVLSFKTRVKESDLDYYSRIKDIYLDTVKVDKVHKFISDVKKRTGAEMPYYAAKAAMEILESYKQSKENAK